MQKSLIVSLYVLATLVLIEARPWHNNGGYDGYSIGYGASGGYGGSSGYGGNGGYMGGQFGGGEHGAIGKYPDPNSYDGDFYSRSREGCVDCVIRRFGDGEENPNTFNLPEEGYV